ncbi:hypothetical protein BC829DRAFT_361318 [Chytridium lagenaria]|nr:hypothetical protein BC829DRAFT_361318 [Chytridium lagenaria]
MTDPFADTTSPTGTASRPASSQISTVISGLAQRIRPLGSQAAKGFSQVSQYARERMGASTDITELPTKFQELEEKVDKIKALHESLVKVSQNYTKPHYDYEPLLSETALDFATNVRGKVVSLAGATTTTREEIPRSLSHALARAATSGSAGLPTEEPLTLALRKFATAHERVGNARLNLDSDATLKFHQPMVATISQQIAHAMKARRKVQAARLTYDAARARLKASKPEREEAARSEMEAMEDEFVAVVDDAMGKMTLVVESGAGTALKSLAELVSAQLVYFKTAYEILAELAPEIDELQVTNEALLRHPSS